MRMIILAMREVQMFDHGDAVMSQHLIWSRPRRSTDAPVEFYDPIDSPFVLRVINVLMPNGEVRRYLASELIPLTE